LLCTPNQRGVVADTSALHGPRFNSTPGMIKEESMAQSNSVVPRAFSLIRRRFMTLSLAAVWPYVTMAASCNFYGLWLHAYQVPGSVGMGAQRKAGWSNPAILFVLNRLQNHSKIIWKLRPDNCFRLLLVRKLMRLPPTLGRAAATGGSITRNENEVR
jgi:hypothetical protein